MAGIVKVLFNVLFVIILETRRLASKASSNTTYPPTPTQTDVLSSFTSLVITSRTVEITSPSVQITPSTINSIRSNSDVKILSSAVTASMASFMETTPVTKKKSNNYSEILSSTVVSSFASPTVTTPSTKGNSNNASEPSVKLYIWHVVAIGCGALVFILIIIIGILSCKVRSLKKKVRAGQSYSLPIKENGAWIDNQDIPLWQKRASTFNIHENPGVDHDGDEDKPTLTT